jgi:capsular exopolysaccharide synthesis family protein
LSQQRVSSYAELLSGKELANRVIAREGLRLTPAEVMGDIQATVVPGTVIIDVTVTSDSADQTYAIAQGLGASFSDEVAALENAPGTAVTPVRVTVVAAPERPTVPSSPSLTTDLTIGLLVGLVLGLVVAVVRDRRDNSLRDEDRAAQAAGAPVLAYVPQDKEATRAPSGQLVAGPLAEAFQVLRTGLQFVAVDVKPRVLMVTSATQGEGKTSTALHLAGALARTGQRVLLVEVDLRRPGLSERLDLVEGVGLTNVLAGTAQLDDVLQSLGGDRQFDVLGAGPRPPSPSDLLASQAMTSLLAVLRDRWDVVILDAPPLLPVADAAALSALADGVLLCIRWGATNESDVERAHALLERSGARTLGAVFTFVPSSASGYGYGYDAPDPRSRRARRRRRRLAQDALENAAAAPEGHPLPSSEPEELREEPATPSGERG